MAQSNPAGEPTLASSIVRSLTDRLTDHEELVVAGLARFSISKKVLYDQQGRLGLRQYMGFFEWLAKELKDPFLGLKVSQTIGPEMLNAVSYLFLCSRDLEQGALSLSKYVCAEQEATSVPVIWDTNQLHVRYSIDDPEITSRRQDAEYSIGFIWNLMRRFSGGNVGAVQIQFEHDKPAGRTTQYQRVFGAPVLFQQEHNGIVLQRKDAHQLNRDYDPNLVPILQAHLDKSLSKRSNIRSFSDTVRAVLDEDMISQGARAKRIADELNISEVTLHRRLRDEGTSFKRLLDDKAKSIAVRLVEHSRYRISDIATRLGYAETACFTRAYQRWFGVSPSARRRNH